MSSFVSRGSRGLFASAIAILTISTLAWQGAAGLAAADFKARLADHDAALAGRLSREGALSPGTAKVFVAEPSRADLEAGRSILAALGYGGTTATALIPEANGLARRFGLVALVLALAPGLALLAALAAFLRSLDRRLAGAAATVGELVGGNRSSRLEEGREGSLSRLFSSVNSMASSLAALAGREQRNREFLKDAIADISHQVKTPLAALRLFVEIARDGSEDPALVARFSEKSLAEIDRMDGLIRGLLELARLDAGAIALESRELGLEPLLEEAIGRFADRAETEGVQISLQGIEGGRIRCDPAWSLEAICNVLKNALDHTPPGGRIAVACEESPLATRISISDTGSGIDPEDIHDIFKRFHKSRRSREGQGVGIGLAIAKAIVEGQGGSISVESEPGRGSAFFLSFPKLTKP